MSANTSSVSTVEIEEETRPLLSPKGSVETIKHDKTSDFRADAPTIIKFIVALTAIFLANADTSLVVATYESIASDLNRSAEGQWLLTGYTLGFIVALPMYGVANDTLGQKVPLLTGLSLFGLGCAISGTAWTLPQIIIGRVIAGFGGGGITSMIDIIVIGLAPLSHVVMIRSYLNVAAVVGRGAGAPLGGLMFDFIGWRWSFLVQVLVIMICIIVAVSQTFPQPQALPPAEKRRKNIDVEGLLTFTLTMVSLLFLLDFATKRGETSKKLFICSAVVFGVSGAVFVLIERYRAKNPMIPLSLIANWSTCPYFVVPTLLMFAQLSLLTHVATYFLRTEGASVTGAALRIVPGPIGNAIGGLIAGYIIRRTKRCKRLSICAAILCIASYSAILLRWRHPVNVWESLYILPAALGLGMLLTAQFIALGAVVSEQQQARSIGFFLFSQSLGMLIGASVSSTLLRKVFRDALVKKLGGVAGWQQLVDEILNDTRFTEKFPHGLQSKVLSSYLQGFSAVSASCVIASTITIPFLVMTSESNFE